FRGHLTKRTMRQGVHDGTTPTQPVQRGVQSRSDPAGTVLGRSARQGGTRPRRLAGNAPVMGPGGAAPVGDAAHRRRAQRAQAPAARGARAADGARDPKKSHGLLRQAERVTFAFIAAEKARFPVRILCRALDVSPSGYYAAQQRAPSPRAQRDTTILRRLHVLHADSRRTYGRPRLRVALRAEGLYVGDRRVRRLMRAGGLVARGRRRYRVTTDS